MAKEFVVIRNNADVVERCDSKAEAEAVALEYLQKFPRSSFEFGKMDKRIFTTATEVSFEYGEEPY